MKRILLKDYTWSEIQIKYDSGLSLRDLCLEYKMSSKTFAKAKDLHYFKPRDISNSMKVRHTVSPRDHSEVRKKRSEFYNYRADCQFKFNVFDYPNEFDLSLIEQHGFYKAKNRGDNPLGVSKDHAISVRYGFDNNIPFEHIAHPANCVLMQQHHNASKGTKISMSYEELLKRIEAWDIKYGLLV